MEIKEVNINNIGNYEKSEMVHYTYPLMVTTYLKIIHSENIWNVGEII